MIAEVTPAADRSTANGSATAFPYTFKINAKTEIEVLQNTTVLTVDVDYTVDGLGVSGGGNVNFLLPPPNLSVITRLRKQPAAQTSDYIANETNLGPRLELDLDKLQMQIQQIKEQLRRGMFLPKQSALADQGMDVPTVGYFARGKVGGGIDWATVVSAGSITIPVPISEGGTGATTQLGALAALNASEIEPTDLAFRIRGSSDQTKKVAFEVDGLTTGQARIQTIQDKNGTLATLEDGQGNPIVNGNLDVWQGGTAFAAAANNSYAADCWKFESSPGTGVVTLNRSTDVPTVGSAGLLLPASIEIDVTTAEAAIAAGEYFMLSYMMEGYLWRHFAQRACTLSFWVRDTKTGTHTVSFRNSGSDRSYVATYTISVADTWEHKTVTVLASPSAGTWDYTTGKGLVIGFPVAVGSNFHTTAGAWQTGNFFGVTAGVNSMDSTSNLFRVTGVKLELGTVATPLQFRSYTDELRLCQRYFQKSFLDATTPAQNAGAASGETIFVSSVAGAVATYHEVRFSQKLRATPTMTYFNPSATNAQARNHTDSADCSATGDSSVTANEFVVTTTGNAGLAAGERIGMHWTADARL